MTSPLTELLVRRIRENGPMPFAAYMQLALYHPKHGYYRAGPRTGRAGHFMTSPELDPAFGALWARGFEAMWRDLGRPDEFHVVEVGPGEGGFAKAVLSVATGAFADALRFDLVERAAGNRERQAGDLAGDERARWHAALAEVPPVAAGCVFANEVLDNLPVHLVERRAGVLHEICVTERDGALELVGLPSVGDELSSFLTRTGLELADGQRCEVTLAAESFVAHAGRVVEAGAIVLIDYGVTTAELGDRLGGTLVAYSSERVDGEVLESPGERDITAHANWTAATDALLRAGFEVEGPRPQHEVLRSFGAAELGDRLDQRREDALGRGEGSAGVRWLSRRQALDALLDPAGLGGLQVLSGRRNLPSPERAEDRP